MANQPELIQYDAGVYQLEATDPVDGGIGAISNKPLLSLANRTAYLKQQTDALAAASNNFAPKNSPALTGTPTTPTPLAGDNSTKIASTEFVDLAKFGISSVNVAGGANITLTQAQWGLGILVLSGIITANIAVIFPAQAGRWLVVNNTTGNFTITAKTPSGTGVLITQGRSSNIWGDGTNIALEQSDFVSPAMTGTPTVPTAVSGTKTTQAASTDFVFNAIDGIVSINAAGNTDVNVTGAQAGTGIIRLTGALTGNINLILPTSSGQWIIANNTTGGFTVTAKHATGTGVVLPQTLAVVVYSDGTNIALASSAGQSSLRLQSYAPASGTTVLTVTNGYTVGNVLVEKNRTWLEPQDFTATNGTTITLTTATGPSDNINVYVFSSFNVANAIQKSGDTMLGSLILAGISTCPTAPVDTSTLQIASTAFVLGQASSASPLMNGVVAVGTSLRYARADHVHPVDSTRAAVASPNFTGVPTAPTAAVNTSNTQVATTAFANPGGSIAGNGWVKLPSGLIIQWGLNATPAGGALTFAFPVVFPNACFSLVAVGVTGGVGACATISRGLPYSNANATLYTGLLNAGGWQAFQQSFFWIAVGN